MACLSNRGYAASLEKGKLYLALSDRAAEKGGLVRVIDEFGEDYLYAKRRFADIDVPREIERALAILGGELHASSCREAALGSSTMRLWRSRLRGSSAAVVGGGNFVIMPQSVPTLQKAVAFASDALDKNIIGTFDSLEVQGLRARAVVVSTAAITCHDSSYS